MVLLERIIARAYNDFSNTDIKGNSWRVIFRWAPSTNLSTLKVGRAFPASRGFLAWRFSGKSRPSDKGGGRGGGGHTDLEIREGGLDKIFWGGAAPGLDPPLLLAFTKSKKPTAWLASDANDFVPRGNYVLPSYSTLGLTWAFPSSLLLWKRLSKNTGKSFIWTWYIWCNSHGTFSITPNTFFELLTIIITVQLFKWYCDVLSLNEVDICGTLFNAWPRLVQKNVMRKRRYKQWLPPEFFVFWANTLNCLLKLS